MKNRIIIALITAFLFSGIAVSVQAQDNCEVLLASIKGTYKGGCDNKKADGEGTSIGIDSYTGSFKKGVPEGNGTYVWQNGDTYVGAFLKGKKTGMGKLTYKSDGKVQEGYWKDDKYVGEHEKPYNIITRPVKVIMMSVKKVGDKNNFIDIQFESSGVGSTTKSGVKDFFADPTKYTNFETLTELPNGMTYRVNNVKFPFRVKLVSTSGQEIEFEIYEKGQWKVMIGMNE